MIAREKEKKGKIFLKTFEDLESLV